MSGRSRKASHAGSWYEKNGSDLRSQLNSWLQRKGEMHGPARAIIAPHAGYYFCGNCGGQAYRQIDPSNIDRVFILGPSHHYRLSGCALSSVSTYETPIYDLPIDKAIYKELKSTGLFDDMDVRTDEQEHSIEMHLPYVATVMEPRRGHFTIVPVLVGSLSTSNERVYGQLFAQYLSDPRNLFVISSDFCHWGSRFHYQHYDKSKGQVWQSIEHLDRKGMSLIEDLNTAGFSQYLREYGNTICGRHPIAVLLNALDALKEKNGHQFKLKFVDYAQSSKVSSMSDSSVSYASASLVVN